MRRTLPLARSRLPPLLRGVRAGASGTPPPPSPVLLRDFLAERLRDYFREGTPVGRLPSPLPFRTFLGRSEYEAAVAKAYRAASTAWLTPSELFCPIYGAAFARAVLAAHAAGPGLAGHPLAVFELGAGGGGFARSFLDCVAAEAPAVHAAMRYTCVDASPALTARQRDTVLLGAGGRRHAAVLTCATAEAADADAWAGAHPRGAPCLVLALELLDNLPHDRAERAGGGAAGGGWAWAETRVVAADLAPRHARPPAPLADPLVIEALALWLARHGRGRHRRLAHTSGATPAAAAAAVSSPLPPDAPWPWRLLPPPPPPAAVFLPTGALALLRALRTRLPAHALVAADFDGLPGVAVAGAGAPLVASQCGGGGATEDHGTYLLPRDVRADVLFPVDFDLLADMDAHVGAAAAAAAGGGGGPLRRGEAVSSAAFLRAHADWRSCTTVGGFNPLLDDFPNTRVFARWW